MSKELDSIKELLRRHYDEAAGGLVDKPPSQLTRGEGAERNYFIMKIDLVGSTALLKRRHKSTYLKLAHTYLSTVDKITQHFGADPEQVEYAGDSVIAYFEEKKVHAEDVLAAACYSKTAVQQIGSLDATLKSMTLKCKIVLHSDTLIVSRIGPRANSILTAIGHPIHQVAKIEKDINEGVGRATKEFYQQVKPENRKYLFPVTVEIQTPITTALSPLNGLLNFSPPTYKSGLLSAADILYGSYSEPPPPQYKTEQLIVGYNINWLRLSTDLGLLK